MKEKIKDLVLDMEDIEVIGKYEFQEIHGFTFVFKSEFIRIKDQISSASIKPIGIIYDENEDIYFAPLVDNADISSIIKSYLESKN